MHDHPMHDPFQTDRCEAVREGETCSKSWRDPIHRFPMTDVPANEVEVGDVIWKEQEMVVVKVNRLSVSTAIDCQRLDRPEGGMTQWHLENWYKVPIYRP